MKKLIIGFKQSLNLVTLSIVLLFIGACEKSLIETPQSFAAPDSFYGNIGQVESALAGNMNSMFLAWSNSNYSWAWRLFTNTDQLKDGDLNITSDQGQDLWLAHYRSLLYINTLIKAINKGSISDATQEEIDVLLGQAKLMRGYNYFALVRYFGDVPLYTEHNEDPSLNPQPRAPISEVYDLIISDLTFASEKLPLTWGSDKIGRPTRGAAKGLLAKAYITMATAPLNETSNYAKARDAAKSCMEDGVHGLVPNIFDLFKTENKYSREMMWSFNANNISQSTHNQMFTPGDLDGWSNAVVAPEFDTIWPKQPRKDAFLLTKYYKIKLADGSVRNISWVPDGATVLDTVGYGDWGSQAPAMGKYLPPNTGQDDYDNYVNVYNVPVIRYADVLLLYAEAANMANGGPTQDAVDALNMVIDRANGNSIGLPGHPRATTSWTVQEFDDAVIQERNFELCFEYDRWNDIVRKRILLEVTPWYYRQNFSPEDYLWPIPQRDLRLNPLLVQNPGYPVPSGQ